MGARTSPERVRERVDVAGVAPQLLSHTAEREPRARAHQRCPLHGPARQAARAAAARLCTYSSICSAHHRALHMQCMRLPDLSQPACPP